MPSLFDFINLNLFLFAISIIVVYGTLEPFPNFIVILADDLGYADSGMSGSPNMMTPNLDRLVLEGMKFTQFYSAPLCTPARGSLFTGKYPIKTGLYTHLTYPNDKYFRVFYPTSVGCLPKNISILPEYLKQAYHDHDHETSFPLYWTGMIGKWHLGHQQRHQCLPNHRGFDYFFGLPYSHEEGWPMEPEGYIWPPVPLYENDKIIQQPVDLTHLTQKYNEKIEYQLQRLSKTRQPFFLHIAYGQPHVPLSVSKEFQGSTLRGLYGDAVAEMDHSIGRLLETLEETGLDQNTFIFFASDNGAWINVTCDLPRFPDCSTIHPEDGGSNGPLRDGKGSTYEGGTRVMAMMRFPGKISPNTRVMNIATMNDLLPTILDLANVQIPPDLDGHSLKHLFQHDHHDDHDKDQHDHALVYFWRESELYAIRYKDYKCHFVTRPPFGDDPPVYHDPCLLFQINHDVSESYPLNNIDYPDIMKILNTVYERATKAQVNYPLSQYEPQDWRVVPCCNGNVTMLEMERLISNGITGFSMWEQLGCVC